MATPTRLFNRVSLCVVDFSGMLLIAMVVLINVEVVLRYVFSSSTLIADEYSSYLFVWVSLLGFGYALETGRLLHVETFVIRIRGTPRIILELFSAMICAMLAAVTAYGCALVFFGNWKFGTVSVQASATPLWLPQIVMPIAFVWLFVLYTRIAVIQIRRLASGEQRT